VGKLAWPRIVTDAAAIDITFLGGEAGKRVKRKREGKAG